MGFGVRRPCVPIPLPSGRWVLGISFLICKTGIIVLTSSNAGEIKSDKALSKLQSTEQSIIISYCHHLFCVKLCPGVEWGRSLELVAKVTL